jgi:hypothetical protein
VFSSTIFITMARGTERNIPTGPQTQPQKTSESTTTSVESPSRRPKSAGSIRLPISMFTARKTAASASAV